jgi:hypothetical protein
MKTDFYVEQLDYTSRNNKKKDFGQMKEVHDYVIITYNVKYKLD